MRGSRRTLAVVLVHLLLAALALGAVAVWGAGADPGRADLRVTAPDPDPRLPANPNLLVIVRPPGTVVLDTTKESHGAKPVAVLPELEAEILDDAGAVNVKAVVSREGGLSRGVWQVAVHDGADPRVALRAVDDLYAAGGWARAPSDVRGLLVRKQTPSADQPVAAYRAHYVTGPYLVRIEAYGTDAGRVDREFAELARRQLAERPPG